MSTDPIYAGIEAPAKDVTSAAWSPAAADARRVRQDGPSPFAVDAAHREDVLADLQEALL